MKYYSKDSFKIKTFELLPDTVQNDNSVKNTVSLDSICTTLNDSLYCRFHACCYKTAK